MKEAIEKINAEMQKSPDDPYIEIIGHYIIDRCADVREAQKVTENGRTLEGTLKAVMDEARKKAKNSVAMLTSEQVFDVVDRYFTFARDDRARSAVMQIGAQAPKGRIDLDLESFL